MRLSYTQGRRLNANVLGRLRDERGAALVMALGMMMVLSAMLGATISLTSSNARASSRSNADQKAFTLAEAGLNNALAVLHVNYPGTEAYPGDPMVLQERKTTYEGGSAIWSGTLIGRLTGPWEYEWRITSTGEVRNPTGPGTSPVTRTIGVVVPVIIPTETPIAPMNVLNWIYSGTDTHFSNTVQIGSPVYATRDLYLSNTAKIRGSARKVVVGRNLILGSPQARAGLVSGLTPADTRIDEVHVVNQCSSHANGTLHPCLWDADLVFATVHDNVIPTSIVTTPKLTCCAPFAGSIAPAGTDNPSSMGFWYEHADLGPMSPCDPATKTGITPTFDTAGYGAIDGSATPAAAFNLTPAGVSYSCKSVPGTRADGELSWNHSTNVLTVKGTIFIDGSVTVANSGTVPTYNGWATLVLSGTFMMKNSKLCAVVSGSDCNVASGAWNPNTKALVIVADGDGGAGGAQSQAGEVAATEGIHLKGASFQGALIANKTIKEETSCAVQGPMISVYNEVRGGQSCALSFPAINFAPAAAAAIATGAPKGQLLAPLSFDG